MNEFQKKTAKSFKNIQTLEDIADDLRYLTIGYPEAAVKAAIDRQPDITPILFNFLIEAIEHHESLSPHYMGHLHAMFLLAQWREIQAFPFIIQLQKIYIILSPPFTTAI